LMAGVMGLSERMLPHIVKEFRFVGSRAVFQGDQKVDRFWYSIAQGRPDTLATLKSNLASFTSSNDGISSAGKTKSNGARVLKSGRDYIRLPVRLPGNALRSRSILVPTRIGKYRFARDETNTTNLVIDLWEEVPGESITRPPEGWDDLGAGGANVQGRWAWGTEKKSTIEEGVAVRRAFFDKDQSMEESIVVAMKLLALGVLSWLVSSTILFAVALAPLSVGRFLYFVFRIPDRWAHDPLAYGLGFTILFSLVQVVTNAILSNEVPLYQSIHTWVSNFHRPPLKKAFVLLQTAFLWLVVTPMLVGMVYDLAFIKTNAWFGGQDPLLDRIQYEWITWTCGTILLHLWSFLCVRGVLTKAFSLWLFEGREAANVDNDAGEDWEGDNVGLGWQGKFGRMSYFYGTWKSVLTGWEWDKVDESVLLYQCAFPVAYSVALVGCLGLLTLGLCIWCFPLLSGSHRAILVRFVMTLVCCIRVGRAWKHQLRNFMKAAHKTARDDRYLIGEILINHGE
jgi:E3 ubiquitin-protein ligase MARCH6